VVVICPRRSPLDGPQTARHVPGATRAHLDRWPFSGPIAAPWCGALPMPAALSLRPGDRSAMPGRLLTSVTAQATYPNSGDTMMVQSDNAGMEIASEETHRLLFYVSAVTRRGYKLSVSEFEAYAKGPMRKTKTVSGGLSAFTDIQAMLGRRRVPAESWLEYLKRLEWVSTEEGIIKLTRLGKTILDELSAPAIDIQSESATEVLLDPSDPHAYVKVVGVLSELGEGLLVDPYFRYDQLETIVDHTEIRRVLTSKKTGNTALSQIQFALAVIDEDQRPEIRVAESLHDRFAIGDNGAVVAIGTSLNSVGKNHSVVVPLSEIAGKGVASVYGGLWDEATALTPRSQNSTP
jgi:hypothetical protein